MDVCLFFTYNYTDIGIRMERGLWNFFDPIFYIEMISDREALSTKGLLRNQ